jgi:general secretion pathway protein G
MIRRRAQRGFTLIEILVVIAILATLATAVVVTVSGKPDEAKVARAKADISAFETALETLRLDMGRYPDEDEGLMALVRRPESEDGEKWRGPYIKRLEKDPWGNPYIYVNPGYENTEGYDLITYGSDGEEGGEGEFDKDIGNWLEEDEEYE